ncbi:hypothetical protein [Nonlabens ponticola]|uniref:Uncharacterized protein n=1 Tax=Nonlabens ponticola TaxID=2496866 RepID=A0A3S9MY31_9FLAO|nr:hypothetical protein [Nonlabens ponticola]AZQ44100.1 hypothetical protein EJ995_07595 [Nonlabens ponticola]
MSYKISIKQIILSLLSVKEQLYKNFKNDNRYNMLLEYLMSKDFYYDDELPVPSVKLISESTEINTYQVRKRIIELNELIYNDENDTFLEFPETEIEFSARNYAGSMFLKMKSIKEVPQVGDDITLPLLRGKLNTDMFFVESKHHFFEGNKQIIHCYLQSGMYNEYWHLRKSEAIFKDEIPFKKRIKMDDYDMKKELSYY